MAKRPKRRRRSNRQLLEQAEQQFVDGDLAQAEDLARQFLDVVPNSAAAMSLLVRIAIFQNELTQAESLLKQMLIHYPSDWDWWLELVKVERALGKIQEAANHLQHVVDHDQDNAVAWCSLGICLAQLERFEPAITALETATKLQPESTAFLLNLAHVYCLVGDVDGAIEANEIAVKLHPDDPQTHLHFASTLSEFGYFEVAIEWYNSALKIDPKLVDAWHQIGNCRMNLQKPIEARAAFDKSIDLDPNSAQIRFNSGMCYLKLKQFPQAIDEFRTSIELDPNYDRPRESLINQLRIQGDRELAMKEIESWLAHEPGNPIAEHLQASIAQQRTPERASSEYVARVFDRYADQFDSSLERLEYRGPQLVAEAVSRLNLPANESLEVVDAGCGTGLCGELLKPWTGRLIGVDLSSGMLKQARKRRVYDELICAELTEYFQSLGQTVQLVVSADTFNYFGRLDELLVAISNCLQPSGHLVFTLEKMNSEAATDQSFELGGHGRYSHSSAYVQRSLEDAGFKLLEVTDGCLRTEADQPVAGRIYVAQANYGGDHRATINSSDRS